LREDDGGARAIAGEDLVRRQSLYLLGRQALGPQLGSGFVARLSPHEGLGLGEEVREEHVVVAAQGRVRLEGSDEVAWNEACPLVQQLIEGVLSVGAGLPPDD